MDKTQDAPIYLPTSDDYRSMAHFTRWRIEPYPAVYLTQDDVMLVKVWSPTGLSRVNVSVRLMTPDGQVIPSFYQYQLTTVGSTPAQQVIDQVEGFILSATVETPDANAGQCYVQLQIVRGRGTGDQTAGQLLTAGYPGQGFAIGYPQTPAGSPTSGASGISTSTVANPAAAADWTYTVPAGVQQILISVTATLTTSATVANRIPVLVIKSPTGQVITQVSALAAQTASTTVTYTWLAGAPSNNVNNVQQMSLPQGLRLMPGSTIQTITSGLSAGDQWSGITITYTQFISA